MNDTDTIDDGHDFLEAVSNLQRYALDIKHASKRMWTVYAHDEAGNLRPTADVEAELMALFSRITLLTVDIGGSVALVAQRARTSDEDYVPYSWAVRWESFAPTVDLRGDRPAPPQPDVIEDPAPAPDPVESLGDAEPEAPELTGAFADADPDELAEVA